jgi:hypothetical protein
MITQIANRRFGAIVMIAKFSLSFPGQNQCHHKNQPESVIKIPIYLLQH